MIEVNNLTKEYDLKEKKIIAINNINFKFEKGKIYGLLGHSGSGKSTFLHILGLLDIPTSGNIIIDYKDVNLLKNFEINKIRSKKIGFIFQNFYLNPNLKAYENVMLPMLINNSINKKNRKKLSILLLKVLGLSDRINHYPKELSGGEQQRVAIARALANNPDIILADEPTASLDEKNEKIIFEFLKRMSKRGKCVIISSHSEIIKQYADIILYLENGNIKNIQEL